MKSSYIRLVDIPTGDYQNNHADAGDASDAVIIATTDPDLFIPHFGLDVGARVHVLDRGGAATTILKEIRCGWFFADMRQLADRWAGHKLLRHVRDQPALSHVEFWLMADTFADHQRDWAIKCGASGIVLRTPQAVSKRMGKRELTNVVGSEDPLDKQLATIDAIFVRFCGPMRAVHIATARDGIANGSVEPSSVAYAAELAQSLTLEDRKAAFLAATSADDEKIDQVTSISESISGDPWFEAVNTVFKKFAGGLGSMLLIADAMESMEKTGTPDRDIYITALASGLSSRRRPAFTNALTAAHL